MPNLIIPATTVRPELVDGFSDKERLRQAQPERVSAQGGRIFFSNAGRSLEFEDEIILVSVGVDIGSSTSHLVFSRIVLERLDNRYTVTERTVLHESDVLLTPYLADQSIDAQTLGLFIAAQYEQAGVEPSAIDSGALILTGVAVRRSNARAIADLFADQAGKFVSVSAGDALETTLSAFGSGAAARSIRESARVMNIDIGGGTSKVSVCEGGELVALTAIDIGARLIVVDTDNRVIRLEEAGRWFAKAAGIDIEIGSTVSELELDRMVACMTEQLLQAAFPLACEADITHLLRLAPLLNGRTPDVLTFSGGVSEYIYERQTQSYGDLGPRLARSIKAALSSNAVTTNIKLGTPDQGIRATVIGASQYTVQVSGSTIYVEPSSSLPLRNVPVIAPQWDLSAPDLDIDLLASRIQSALRRLDLQDGLQPVGLCYRFSGSATYSRLDAFCRAAAKGMTAITAQGHPLLLVGEVDCGGLIGIHCQVELGLTCPIVSIDGIELKELDFIDIGEILDTSGAVPVVIKSLVFPTSCALGQQG